MKILKEVVLTDDVIDLVEWESKSLNLMLEANYNLLKEIQKKESDSFIHLLSKEVQLHNQLTFKLAETRLKVSGTFQFFPISLDTYSIIQHDTGKFHAEIEKEEFEIIELFRNGRKVGDAIRNSMYAKEPETMIDFINELLKTGRIK